MQFSVFVCAAAAVGGCTQNASDPGQSNRTAARTLRDFEAQRLEQSPEEEANTPVERLFINEDKLEIEDLLRPIRAELTQAAETLPPAQYQPRLRDAILEEFRQQVRALLLYQQAAKRLSEQEEEFIRGLVDDAVRKRVNGEFGGRQARYEKALNEQGLTLAEDRERIRRELVTMRYLHQTIMNRVLDPTRAELMRFYAEQRKHLSKPERRKMSLIEIPAGSADAREQVAQATSELEGGADFASVARRYCQGLHAEEGGAWGWLSRGSVRERWAPAVEELFRLPEGRIGSVVETGESFFIVRCDGIEPAVEPDFETLQPELTQAYRDMQFIRLREERVRQLHEEAVFVPENIGRFLQAVADAAPQPGNP